MIGRRTVAGAWLLSMFAVAPCAAVFNGAELLAPPPDGARAETWWHWMNGEISTEGITADLEAAKRMGLCAVQLFNAGGSNLPNVLPPEKRMRCLSPQWEECVRHAMRECKRLGLGLYAQNSAGWSGGGGPWITPTNAMFDIETKSVDVAPGGVATIAPPDSWPKKGHRFYADICAYAFPTPPLARVPALPKPVLTCSDPTVDPSLLLRSPKDATPKLYVPKEQQTKSIQRRFGAGETFTVTFDYGRPVTVRALEIMSSPMNELSSAGTAAKRLPVRRVRDSVGLTVAAGEDDAHLREIAAVPGYQAVWHHVGHNFAHALPPTTARRFRLTWKADPDLFGTISVSLGRAVFAAAPTLSAFEAQQGYESRSLLGGNVDLPDEPGEAVAAPVDVTKAIGADGTLRWQAPAGGTSCTVVRIGYRSLTRGVAPAMAGGTGLECDKLSAATASYHYDHFCGVLKRLAREAGAESAFKGILVDSYEARTQTWTHDFAEQFERRRGYSPRPYLIAYAGYIVRDRATTRRFLRDMRQTGSDLISENFYGELRRRAHADGLTLAAETCSGGAAGTFVGDGLQHHFETDYPMTESNGNGAGKKMAVSAADNAGLPVVAMEAHTSGIDWSETPARLFADESLFFADGINRIVFHTTGHNPTLDRVRPGVNFSSYGCSPSRGRVWSVDAHAWLDTVARIQNLLRRGTPVADIAVWYGEEAMGPDIGIKGAGDGEPLAGLDTWKRAGYDWSMLSPHRFLKTFRMRGDRMGDPNGVQYRLLILRNCRYMSAAAAEKILAFAKAGLAVSVETVPESAPGLADRAAQDARVKAAVAELVGDLDGRTRTVRRLGKGLVLRGLSVAEAVAKIGLPPDVIDVRRATTVRARHRRDGATDIWYLSALNAEIDRRTTCAFRVAGKKPFVFDPILNEVYAPENIAEKDGVTTADLRFSRNQPIFVIFRPDGTPPPRRAMPFSGVKTFAVTTPWNVTFEGPRAPSAMTLATLTNLCLRAEDDVKYFSGFITYETTFDFAAQTKVAELTLGRLGVTAEVTLNGRPLGVAWVPPYRLTGVAQALRPGRNTLRVRVANTWYNRLCGDAKLPPEQRVTWASYSRITEKSTVDRQVSGLLGPVKVDFAD